MIIVLRLANKNENMSTMNTLKGNFPAGCTVSILQKTQKYFIISGVSGEYSFTLCVCLCVCVFSEVSEMVMPLTPMQGRLNSWYWLVNIYHRGFKLFNSISTEGCRRRGRKSPGSVLLAHKHTRVHKPDTLTAHWASYSPVISTQSDFNPSPAYRDKCSQHNKGCVCAFVFQRARVCFLFVSDVRLFERLPHRGD